MTHCDTLWHIVIHCDTMLHIFMLKSSKQVISFCNPKQLPNVTKFCRGLSFFLFERKTQNFAQEYFWPVFSFLEEKNNCLMVRYMCFYQVIVFTHSENQGFGQAKLGFSGLVLSSSQYSPLPNLLPKCHSFQKWSKGT